MLAMDLINAVHNHSMFLTIFANFLLMFVDAVLIDKSLIVTTEPSFVFAISIAIKNHSILFNN